MTGVMRNAVLALLATLLSVATILPTTQAAHAGSRDRAFLRGALAGAAGAIIIDRLAHGPRYHGPRHYRRPHYGYGYDYGYRHHRPVVVYRDVPVYRTVPVYREVPVDRRGVRVRRAERAWADHVAYCRARYRSYRVSDDTYQPFHGPRRRCV